MRLLHELRRGWHYRELLWLLTRADLKVRYKGSSLGFLWGLLHPLLHLAILSVVFTHLLDRGGGTERYPLYLLSGILPWQFFAQTASRSARAVIARRSLIRKASVPLLLFPVAATLSSFVNLLLSLPALLLLAVVLGAPLGWGQLYLPVGFALLFCFVAGVTMLVSCANVFFRDVEHLVDLAIYLLFFLTPIIYALDWLPPHISSWLRFNPITPLIHGIRIPMYYGDWPPLETVTLAASTAGISLFVGLQTYTRTQHRFVFHV